MGLSEDTGPVLDRGWRWIGIRRSQVPARASAGAQPDLPRAPRRRSRGPASSRFRQEDALGVKSQLGAPSRDRPLPLPLCGINPRLSLQGKNRKPCGCGPWSDGVGSSFRSATPKPRPRLAHRRSWIPAQRERVWGPTTTLHGPQMGPDPSPSSTPTPPPPRPHGCSDPHH